MDVPGCGSLAHDESRQAGVEPYLYTAAAQDTAGAVCGRMRCVDGGRDSAAGEIPFAPAPGDGIAHRLGVIGMVPLPWQTSVSSWIDMVHDIMGCTLLALHLSVHVALS